MICPECSSDFTPKRSGQRFCCQLHKDAWHNTRKAQAIILVPRALHYVQGLAEARGISNNEMANEMILRQANADGQPLGKDEMYGQNGGNGL